MPLENSRKLVELSDFGLVRKVWHWNLELLQGKPSSLQFDNVDREVVRQDVTGKSF